MKRIIHKIIVFTLMITLLVPSFTGCAAESDEELIATAKLLLEKSKTVNEICYGKGLAFMEEGGHSLSGYLEVTKEDRERYAVSSVEDIKALVREVYSFATCEQVDATIFAPIYTETGYVSYRRYFDTTTEDGVSHLMVKKEYEPFVVGEVRYDNIRISSHKRNRAEILADITVTEGERTRTDKDVSFAMRREEGVWKFDALTYASIE